LIYFLDIPVIVPRNGYLRYKFFSSYMFHGFLGARNFTAGPNSFKSGKVSQDITPQVPQGKFPIQIKVKKIHSK